MKMVKTWWPRTRGITGIDHWFEENGRVFVVYMDGSLNKVAASPEFMMECAKKKAIIERDLPEEHSKIPRNNTRVWVCIRGGQRRSGR